MFVEVRGMIRTDLLKEMMLQNGLTQTQVASRLGMTTRTFYKRMKSGVFRSDEMEAMADMLHLQDPLTVFFYRPSSERGAEHGRSV